MRQTRKCAQDQSCWESSNLYVARRALLHKRRICIVIAICRILFAKKICWLVILITLIQIKKQKQRMTWIERMNIKIILFYPKVCCFSRKTFSDNKLEMRNDTKTLL